MGRRKRLQLNPYAKEFVPAVVSSCEGKYSAESNASWKIMDGEIVKSSRPRPYSNNNMDKLSFSFLETDDEINEPRVDFVSELPSLVVEIILKNLDVTSIQNCRKVSCRWNEVIIELQPNVIKDIVSDAAFIRRLVDSRLSENMPKEPFYQDKKCATCAVDKDYCNNIWAIKHDLVKLITYYYECEDKSKKYDCPHCPDWLVNDGEYDLMEYGLVTDDESDESDTEESFWGWEEGDYVRRPAKVKSPVKRHFRSLWKHFSHILLRHEDEIHQFLMTKQKLIPMPKWCVDQTGWIDKLTEDMIFLEHAEYLLSDDDL